MNGHQKPADRCSHDARVSVRSAIDDICSKRSLPGNTGKVDGESTLC